MCSLRELPFLTVSSTSPASENLMPFRPNFSSRVSGIDGVVRVEVKEEEEEEEAEGLVMVGLRTQKDRMEAIFNQVMLSLKSSLGLL